MNATRHRDLVEPAPVLLIVDDDAAVLNSLRFSLELEGFAVRLYSDAGSLLKDPDLPACGCLLLDCYMPDMTGLELLAELRSRNVTLPAVLITGHPSQTLRDRASKVGVPVIDKPLLGNCLIETIRTVIKSQGKLRQ